MAAAASSEFFSMPNMEKLGLFQIDGVSCGPRKKEDFQGAVGRMTERSRGKDTTIGHWEIAGMVSEQPLPTFPNGFPEELLAEFSRETGRGVLCNRPYSGTEVIKDFGRKHVETGDLIVYTSADSVFQIAAHEAVVPVDVYKRQLHRCGKHGYGSRHGNRKGLVQGAVSHQVYPDRQTFQVLSLIHI